MCKSDPITRAPTPTPKLPKIFSGLWVPLEENTDCFIETAHPRGAAGQPHPCFSTRLLANRSSFALKAPCSLLPQDLPGHCPSLGMLFLPFFTWLIPPQPSLLIVTVPFLERSSPVPDLIWSLAVVTLFSWSPVLFPVSLPTICNCLCVCVCL